VPTPAPSAPPIQDGTASEGPIYWSCEPLATNFAGRTALHFSLVHSTDADPLYVLRSDRIKNEGKDDCDESLRVVACNYNNSSACIGEILLRWPMDVNKVDIEYERSSLSWVCEDCEGRILCEGQTSVLHWSTR
jgi:hypothetical protein